jgi:adenosine kinase
MILCSGSIAYDYLMNFPGYFKDHILPDRLDCLSLSFLVDTMIKQYGGTAPNIAYTLALLGEKPWVIGTVGEDFEDYREWLEEHGVNTSNIHVIPGKYTASFFANTDLANAQIASFYTGAMANAAEISLHEFKKKFPDLVIISPNDPKAMRLYTEECQELKIPYLYDPSQQIVRIDPEDVQLGVMGCTSLFVNDYEYSLLQKHTGLTHSQIIAKAQFVVVTKGEKGALIFTEGRQYSIPIVQASQIADPTGVGDAFRGGFIRGYGLKLDWQTCGQMGALAATYCLEQRGTQNHHYTPKEFVRRYRENFDDKGNLDILLEILEIKK